MDYTGIETTIYIDVMLATNFFMDLLIIWAAGRVAGCIASRRRLLLGALVGAAYSLTVLFPDCFILHFLPVKIGCSLAMLLVTYYPLKRRTFFVVILNFYLISFAMGGAVIAATYIFDDAPALIQVINMAGIFRGNINYWLLVIALLVAATIGWGGLTILRKRSLQRDLFNTLTISLQDNVVETIALLDTGNQLREPLTNRPVVVVEAALLEDNLPAYLLQVVGGELLLPELVAGVEGEWLERLTLIPYNSVGRQNGLMVGLRPDWVELTTSNGTVRLQDVVLGLSDKPLNKEGKYRALVPLMVLEGI